MVEHSTGPSSRPTLSLLPPSSLLPRPHTIKTTGYKAAGDISMLQQLAAEHGMGCSAVDLVPTDPCEQQQQQQEQEQQGGSRANSNSSSNGEEPVPVSSSGGGGGGGG